MLLIIIKKTIAVLVLVEPIGMIPIFLATVAGLRENQKRRFAVALGFTVFTVLAVSGIWGKSILEIFDISIGGMKVAGGIIAFVIAMAMITGHESSVKHTIAEENASIGGHGRSVVPLGIPLLAGPAAISYMMTSVHNENVVVDLTLVLVPSLIAGVVTWISFRFALKVGKHLQQGTLDVVGRLAGFIVAAIAVDLVASGIRSLFNL